MKLVTISGALQSGLITPSSVFTVPYQISLGGWPFADAEYHPTEQLSATQILSQSSNIGTIEIAHLLGPDRLSYFLRDLGFGQPTGLEWPGETAGLVPSPSDPATWSSSSMGTVPIGTGEAVTPLQILDAYNMVANDGELVAPRLVEATISAKGVEHVLPVQHERRALSPQTVSELLPMLEKVTEDGTALAARIPGYTVAGKTGTAQIPSTTGPGYQPGAWSATFVGFAPAQNPALTTFVMLSHPTSSTEAWPPLRSSPRSCVTHCATSTSRPRAAKAFLGLVGCRWLVSCAAAVRSRPGGRAGSGRRAARPGNDHRRGVRHRRHLGDIRPSQRRSRRFALLPAGRPPRRP